MLDYLLQKTGDPPGAYPASIGATGSGEAPAVLLAWMPSPVNRKPTAEDLDVGGTLTAERGTFVGAVSKNSLLCRQGPSAVQVFRRCC
jgi:hypothetical protein